MFNAEGKPQGVDIIILNYNNRGLIEKCVESVKENTDGQFNLIVVDQGSTDGSRDWLRNKVSHLILNDENVGAWEGRNQGVREARHELVVFLDSDVEIKDGNWIDKMWCYTIDKDVGLVEARVKIWDGTYRFAGFACCMIKRKVFREIGLFDGKFLIGGDLDFWVRFGWNGKFKAEFADDTDVEHHCGGTLTTGCLKEQREELNKKYRVDLMGYKYSLSFIGDTLMKMNKRRNEEEIKRGWRK